MEIPHTHYYRTWIFSIKDQCLKIAHWSETVHLAFVFLRALVIVTWLISRQELDVGGLRPSSLPANRRCTSASCTSSSSIFYDLNSTLLSWLSQSIRKLRGVKNQAQTPVIEIWRPGTLQKSHSARLFPRTESLAIRTREQTLQWSCEGGYMSRCSQRDLSRSFSLTKLSLLTTSISRSRWIIVILQGSPLDELHTIFVLQSSQISKKCTKMRHRHRFYLKMTLLSSAKPIGPANPLIAAVQHSFIALGEFSCFHPKPKRCSEIVIASHVDGPFPCPKTGEEANHNWSWVYDMLGGTPRRPR